MKEHMQTRRVAASAVKVGESLKNGRIRLLSTSEMDSLSACSVVKYWVYAKLTMSKDISIPPMQHLTRNIHLDLRKELSR